MDFNRIFPLLDTAGFRKLCAHIRSSVSRGHTNMLKTDKCVHGAENCPNETPLGLVVQIAGDMVQSVWRTWVGERYHLITVNK